ncbi:hypothetical protein PVAP13_3NG311312 [Panicum virgatum]|uniref:Uncharacterized protein n=1 Tax=Panicum virgatum TaxID=38727 RepID=A0A8T0UHE4_PANVG|nr:hypothetical protein PVAP13_3NG311312 [Panicum virgatum]
MTSPFEGPNLTQKPSKTAAPVWNAMIILGSEEILTSPTCLPLDASMAYREMHGSSKGQDRRPCR